MQGMHPKRGYALRVYTHSMRGWLQSGSKPVNFEVKRGEVTKALSLCSIPTTGHLTGVKRIKKEDNSTS